MHPHVFSDNIFSLQGELAHHSIPSDDLSISDCRRQLILHLLTGACVDLEMDVRHERVTCRSVAIGFKSAAELASANLNVIVSATSENLPTARMAIIAQTLGFDVAGKRNHRRSLLMFLKKRLDTLRTSSAQDSITTTVDLFRSFESLPKHFLLGQAYLHGIQLPPRPTSDKLRSLLLRHVTTGSCASSSSSEQPTGCSIIVDEYRQQNISGSSSNVHIQIYILSSLVKKLTFNPMRRLLQAHNVEFDEDDSLSKLRRLLKRYIYRLKKGKYSEDRQTNIDANRARNENARNTLIKSWPNQIPKSLKDKLLKEFYRLTSKEELSSFTCASCAEECLNKERCNVFLDDVDMDVLLRPDHRDANHNWLDVDCSQPPLPYNEGPLKDLLLDPAGVSVDTHGNPSILLCKSCLSSMKKKKVPPLSLANRTYLGPIPDELKDLTVIEEAMIACCRSKCWVIQLKDDRELGLPTSQRAMKGHIIIYPQRPSQIAAVLPPSIEDVLTPICVIFVGSSPPSAAWLREKAKPLTVRREKVRSALIWLKQHNRHYKHITINHDMLNQLEDQQILPFSIEHVLPSQANESLTSRYDTTSSLETHCQAPLDAPIPFQNVVITDVDARAPANELRAAAVRHVIKKGGSYIEIPHDAQPVNEFCNPDLFPMIYPTLFPYGIGGLEDSDRESKLSMKKHVKHLFSLADRRFQEHYSFLFTAFNMLQRREVLLRTSLKVKRSNFPSVAANFASVSPQAVHIVSQRIANGDSITANTDDERKVLNLMRQVKLVSSHVPGSSGSRIAMRNEIRGLMMDKGLPSFYITINPADVFNPLVKFLAGAEIDVDCLLPEHVPDYWEQSILVARNPAVASKFFHLYMQAFIAALLNYDPTQKDLEGGILGVVKAYYGCVEAQGRGTLHCHMMVWLEGGLNPNEIKQRVVDENDTDFCKRLLAYLDDTISNAIPPDPDPDLIVPSSSHHPCSVRGISNMLFPGQELNNARLKDMHNLVKQCQSHKHSSTCYKYWKGPPNPKECRFDLDAENVRSESSIDMETGEINLRCLDGLVNNFNATMLEAIRCNMDIKFIGSGASAKAILYYITDYITKTQLKTHVAFAALELAVKKLGEYDPAVDDYTIRAKRLLQKCAHAMITHQELSAQQVCSYLMEYGDHYTSHEYRNLYWTSFERHIDGEEPSPECLGHAASDNVEHENLQLNNPECLHNESIGDVEDDCTLNNGETDDDDLFDDVIVAFSPIGEVVPRCNQVADYVFRGNELDGLCVWDSIAQVDKVIRPRCNTTTNMDISDGEDVDEDIHVPDHSIIDELLSRKTRKRPKINLVEPHLEAASHILRVRSPDKRYVPVPIGPSIPRRDRDEVKARYCRLMLILFKPWRRASDLRSAGQSWESSFEEFTVECSIRYRKIMDNMQILHECRDSRDDHFAQRLGGCRSLANRLSQEITGRRDASDDFGGEDDDEGLILEHLESIGACHSHKSASGNEMALQCIEYLARGGFWSERSSEALNHSTSSEQFEVEVHESQPTLEESWRKAYEDRRDLSRYKSTQTEVGIMVDQQNISQQTEMRSVLQDGSAFRTSFNVSTESRLPAVRSEVAAVTAGSDGDQLEDIIKSFTLNTEQERAFRIVANHSMQLKPDPLRMYIGGPGGTGKSRVIHALKSFFESQGQGRRLRLTSYTGVAARNIGGMTLHSALCLNQRSGKSSKGCSTRRSLVAMWEGVDYMFVDEVSMIGCNFLLQISEALIEAKGNTSAFGGINIIFCGDFAQLPPVGQTRLFARIDTRGLARCGTTRGQNTVLGKLLWLSVKIVVILHEIKRQTGRGNEEFVSLLGRLREGRCTDADYELLQTRVLGAVQPDWSDPSWRHVPIIVTENAAKDAINASAAAAFAQHTRQQLHWYYATDTRGGKTLTDNVLKSCLENLNSGHTNQRLGKIPLVVGMPVMFTHNFDVDGGIVNGSIGILKSIRYRLDSQQQRHAISCVVEVTDSTGPALPHLPQHHVVALEETVDMTFTHPYSGKKCLIKRTQVPITPAFAMTAHKSQGKTLQNAVIDLEGCRGTETPYVMVSRVSTLDGLLILRPFSKTRITRRQSEDSRREEQRLNLLRLQTITQTGTSNESNVASLALICADTGYNTTRDKSPSGAPADALRDPRSNIHHDGVVPQESGVPPIRFLTHRSRSVSPEPIDSSSRKRRRLG